MRVNAYIGVMVPGVLELARQALVGMRKWCDSHPQIGLNIISEYGDSAPPPPSAGIPFIGVITFTINDEIRAGLERYSRNLVCISNRDPAFAATRVVNDDLAIGRMGVDYFHNRGYRTIAFLGRPDLGFSRLREQGYRDRMRALALPCHVYGRVNPLSGTAASLLALDARVAVVCAADNFARELVQVLEEPLTTVPARMAVLGVDDDTLQNALSPVSLSSVRLSGERIGYAAADLVHRLHSGAKPPAKPVLIPPQAIVTRRSTNALAIDDPLVLRVMRLIQDRVSDFQDVPSLLQEVKVSRRTLETRFRHATGRSLLQELTAARIDKARGLLASTRLSMKEIADLLGLADQRQFSLVYKRVTGETPTEYRSRVQPQAG